MCGSRSLPAATSPTRLSPQISWMHARAAKADREMHCSSRQSEACLTESAPAPKPGEGPLVRWVNEAPS